MKIIAEGECWSQKWSQDRADMESVSDQQFCCAYYAAYACIEVIYCCSALVSTVII